MDITIIYEDDNIVAVNKPAGIAVHGGITQKEETVIDCLIEKFPEIKNVGDDINFRPGIVHRLDKDTSGIMVIARKQEVFQHLKKQFQDRTVVKKYLALVEGGLKIDPTIEQFGRRIINSPISRSRNDFRKKVVSKESQGKSREAVTEFNVLEEFPDYTLVEVYPKTGRTHQVRVHFKSIGNPVVCDSLYGGKKKTCPGGLARHFLHASFLEFTSSPGVSLKLEAALPSDLKNILKILRKK